MEKKLLITVGDETSCLFGVRFLSSFFQNKSLFQITLFCVAPPLDYANRSAGQVHSQIGGKSVAGDVLSKAGMALQTSRNILGNWGFAPERITSRVQVEESGIVKDIIKEARQGLYDAVVLGKCGYSLFESIFATSVATRMLADDIEFPLWISRMPEHGRKNVLLCVDGSAASLRVADHVGFMLHEEDHRITILHVDTGGGKKVDAILQAALARLTDNGIGEDRIHIAVIKSQKVVPTILEEAERKAFAVVAVGRVGENKGGLADWFIGSRSMKLLQRMEKAVMWVSK